MGFHSRSVFANASCACQFGIRKCIVVESLGNPLLGPSKLDKAFTKPHFLNLLVLDRLTVNGDNAVDSHVSFVVSLCVLPLQIYRFGARVAKFSQQQQQQHIASHHTMERKHDEKEQVRQLKELQEKMAEMQQKIAEMQQAEMERVRKAEIADEIARVRAEEEKVRTDREKEKRVRIIYADEALR